MARVGRTIVAGVAKETVRGVIDDVPVIYWLRILDQPHQDVPTYLDSAGSIGTVVDLSTSEVNSTMAEGGLEYELDSLSIVLILWSIFGDLVSAQIGVTGAYTHELELDNLAERQSLSLFVNEPGRELGFPLFNCGELSMEFAVGKRPAITASGQSKKSQTFATTPVFEENANLFRPKDITFYMADDIDGLDSATKIDLKSLSLSINTNQEADEVVGEDGPINFHQKQLSAESEIELLYEDDSFRQIMLAGTPKAFRIKIANSANLAYAGAKSSGTITVADYTGLSGDTITVGAFTLTEGVDFNAVTDNDTTATNIASAINALNGLEASATTDTVTILSATVGVAGDSIGLSTSAGADLTLSGANLTAGEDAIPSAIQFDFAKGYFQSGSEGNGQDDLKTQNFTIKYGQNLNEVDIQFCKVTVTNTVDAY